MIEALLTYERCLARRVIDPATDCWLSTYKQTHNGYAQVTLSRTGRTVRVHRLSMAVKLGVPLHELDSFCDDSGQPLTVDHLCRTPLCFNPAHLDLVAMRVNVLRGETITAANVARTACPRGHVLTPENLIASGVRSGRRQCLTCSRVRSRLNSAQRRSLPVLTFTEVEARVMAARR